MKKIKAVLFDFDGTIADSLSLAYQILSSNLEKEISENELKKLQKKSIPEILEKLQISFFKGLYIVYKTKKEMAKRGDEIKLFPGIKRLIKLLKKEGFLLGVLSNNKKKIITDFFKKNQINEFNFVSGALFSFDKKKKLKKFLKRYKLNPQEVVYIGDQLTDIIDAKEVGLRVIAVTWGLENKQLLSSESPDFLASSCEDIFIWLDLLK